MKNAKFSLCLFALVFLCAVVHTSYAQEAKYAQAGMQFLKLDASPRVAAMGGTTTGVIGTAAAMFSNPAGTAQLEGGEVAGSVTDWIAQMTFYSAGAAYTAGNLGTFGVNLVSMDYGEMTRTVPYQGTNPEDRNRGYLNLGDFTVSSSAVGLTYARQVATRFYFGGSLRYAHQNLGEVTIYDELQGRDATVENTVSNIVLDFGTLYYTGFKDHRIGVSIQNFSNQSDYFDQRFELPLSFEFGTAIDALSLFSDEEERNSELVVAADWIHPRDYSERMHIGMEYGFMDTFYLRGGYKVNYDEEGLSGGLGIDTGFENVQLKADYSYSAFGIFNSVHRIGLGIGIY